jgi:UDP-N-acetylmuramate dehydrogenase
MLNISENVSLKPYNTFGIDALARYFVTISTLEQLKELLEQDLLKKMPLLILGGGSNVLFAGNFEGIVVRIANKGIDVIKDDEEEAIIRVSAGENWHEFVLWCINRGLGGVENLSLIPGNVGSCPIQNIGAYGVEVKECIHSLSAFHLDSGEQFELRKEDCLFGYRNSIFKNELKGKVIIWNVTFRLSRKSELHLKYGAIQQELDFMGISDPGIKDISEAVCHIRQSKLPDPALIGNAGSFFKNPSVNADQAAALKKSFPGISMYSLPDGNIKLAAGWMIEQCGWKGYRNGDSGVHPKQALVLVNYGNATGSELIELAGRIQESVFEKFGVRIEMEVNVY